MKKWLIASLLLNVLLISSWLYIRYTWFPAVMERGRVGVSDSRIGQFEMSREIGGARGVVFFGDSITQGGLWSELFPDQRALNRGIGGDTTTHLLERVDQIYDLEPDKLFLMIGINDLNTDMPRAETFANLDRLFDGFDARIPGTRIYVQSVLPINDDWVNALDPADIDAINEKLIAEAGARGYEFVDLRSVFTDATGKLDRSLSYDGIHLGGAGYGRWREQIAPFVADRTARAEGEQAG